METFKDPGITVEQIVLIKANIEMANQDGKPEYSICLTALGRIETNDGKNLDLHAVFNMMHGIEKPLFKFTCQFVARYTRRDDGMAWKDFTSAIALAHIIPYLREFVSNITNRLPVPVLILPPINTNAMIADYEKRKQQIQAAKAAT